MPRLHTSRAFTLLELLVVVTIIAILISLLVPALDRVMSAATNAQCLAKVKAFSMAYRLYAQDSQGDVMLITTASGDYWHHKLGREMGHRSFGVNNDFSDNKFLMCPDSAAVAETAAKTAWNYQGLGSYGANLWIFNYPEGRYPINSYPPAGEDVDENFHFKFDRAPGNTPVIGDCSWIGSWPHDTETPPFDYDGAGSNHMGRFALNRHNMTVNLCFVDGSGRNMQMGELWSVPWHRTFKVSTKDLP